MDWVKKHYDLVILAMASLLLVMNAGWIAWKASIPSEDFAGVPKQTELNDQFPKPDLAEIAKATTEGTEPARWQPDTTGTKESLFVSRKYLLKDGVLLDPVEGKTDLHPPISNAWLIENGLELTNSRIKEEDNDKDGFTNLEEFNSNTNPKDASSTPPSFKKLQLVAYKPKPFRILFMGDGGTEGKEFQINFKDLKGAARTQYKKKGELIADAPYKIIDYIPKPGTYGINAIGDKSELKIKNTITDETLTLIYNVERDDPASSGDFRNALTKEEFPLKKGQEFILQPDSSKFKLISIDENLAKIKNMSSGIVEEIKKSPHSSP